jgi:polysaccharide pyruvyl transferase WcaK-like protein
MNGWYPIKKVAVFAHSGKGNLGDEATLAAVIQNVERRHPSAEICAFTLNPVDTHARHKVPAFPIRRPKDARQAAAGPAHGPPEGLDPTAVRPSHPIKQLLKRIPVLGTVLRRVHTGVGSIPALVAELAFLARSSRHLKGVDLFVVAGGGQLGDYFGGAWGFPYTIFKWSVLAKVRGAKLAFLSVGAGPITSPVSKLLFRWSLSLASYRSFRDEGSRKLIESLGVSGEHHVFPDLVHGWQPPGPRSGSHQPSRVIGINPLPFHDARYWAQDDPEVYERYVRTLARFAVRVIESGQRVLLFPTQVAADPPVIKDLETLIRDRVSGAGGGCLICPPVASFDELLRAIGQTDVVVASRFHGIIISLLMGKPVIGLAYNQKTTELMADVGLCDLFADIGRFEVPWLESCVARLQADSGDLRDRFESRKSDYRRALENQYGHLLGAATAAALHPARQAV